MVNQPIPDLVRDTMVALAPGLSHLVIGWALLG
jgi:hypothetical protein